MAEGKKLPVSVVITAVDNVTYRVMSINEKIKRITAPVSKVRAVFKTLGDEAGLSKIGKHLSQVGSAGKAFFSDLGDALFKVGAIGLSAAGSLFAITKSFAEAGDNVAMLAARLGLSTDAYQELSYAASRADVDQETFNSSMQKFSKGIAEAAAGQGEALVAFNAMNISVRDSTGRLRTLESMLPEVADKLGAISNQNLRNALAAKIFGREGMKLNGIFMEGAEGLERLRGEAHRVGAVMTKEQIKAAEDFDDAMKSVGATVLMVRNVIGAALAPKLVELGQKLQTYILGNKDKIAAFANAFAEKLPGIFDRIISLSHSVGAGIQSVVDRFGAANVVGAALAAWIGGPLLAGFVALTQALGVLGLTFAGTPIGLLVAGVAALVAGLVLLYNKVTLIRVIADWFGKHLVNAINDAIDAFSKMFGWIDAVTSPLAKLFGGTTKVEGSVSTAAAPSAKLGPAMGFGKTVDAAARSSTQRNENHVLVDFSNLPTGTRVETKKSDGGLDLSMGYGLAGGMP